MVAMCPLGATYGRDMLCGSPKAWTRMFAALFIFFRSWLHIYTTFTSSLATELHAVGWLTRLLSSLTALVRASFRMLLNITASTFRRQRALLGLLMGVTLHGSARSCRDGPVAFEGHCVAS